MKKLLLLFFLSPFFTTAESISWDGSVDVMELGNKVATLEDPQGTLSFADVSSAAYREKFIASKNINLQFGYTESFYWMKLNVNNHSGKVILLELSQAGLPYTDLYYRNASGEVQVMHAGNMTPYSEKNIKSSYQVFALPPGENEYYVRFNTNSGPVPVRLYSEDSYQEKANTQKIVYGIYLGLMLFVFVSNLFFFFSLRNSLFLFNAVNVLIFMSYAAVVVDGFIVYFLQHIDMLFWYTTVPPIGVTIQLIYCLWFLEVKKYRPKLNRFAIGVVVVFSAWFIAKFFLRFPVVQPVNTLQALLSMFVMGYIGMRVGKHGNKFGYYIALTYFAYFVLVLMEATYINTGSPSYILGFSYSGYATVVEALAFSFLLSKRLEWEKREIEMAEANARQRLLEKTLENEKMVREQNMVLEQKVTERTTELVLEKKKLDQLLLNILPQEIADELKATGVMKSKRYDSVSILFADIKDFTSISEKITADELVAEIDHCFRNFDRIVREHGLEKIKTIGDAYMCAGGLPAKNETHPHDIIHAALKMLDFIGEYQEQRKKKGEIYFEIRIGINTGPVVAGVVGDNKFAYDIWGDAVNLAARMEQTSEPGKVNISGNTYHLVKERFMLTHRGKVKAKSKGEIDMYFVEGINQSVQI